MKLFIGAVLVVIVIGFSVILYAAECLDGIEDVCIHDVSGNRNRETQGEQDGTEKF
jgi:hypothetical protein